MFNSNRHVFVRRRAGERMISACVFPTVKHGGGGVMVLYWWHCLIYLEFKAHLNSMAITDSAAIPSGLRLVGLSFVFKQDNIPTHLQAV